VPRLRRAVAALLACASLSLAPSAQTPPRAARSHLVIVVDGLRPDYVTPDVMPRLSALRARGIEFTAHHAVFPTVTRVNASSFATGAYPEAHGLLGNTIYVSAVDRTAPFDTGARENLEKVERAEGRLLTAPGLGEILPAAGKRYLVVSSGSTGAALLLNPRGSSVTVQTEFVRPADIAPRVAAALGPVPARATPNDAQNQYAIDAYLKFGLTEIQPDVTFMWLNDPDATAHEAGIGAALTRQSLSLVDAGIGRIEDALRGRGLLDRTNILVTSDHGFSTHTGMLQLARIVEPLATPLLDGSKDIVIAEGAIYLRGPADPARIAKIVTALQQRPEVGAIFTRGAREGSPEGIVPGTLSFDVARWTHARSGDILVSANWTADANEAGYKGTATAGGAAGHGSSSPYDVHNTLIAAGPDFRERATSAVPTANVDVAPTLLHLLGVSAPPTMAGRVIREGLRGGPAPAGVRVERRTETVTTPDGAYQLTAHVSLVSGYRYLDFTEVTRR
jgi:arylsulfatase A-like enzyme